MRKLFTAIMLIGVLAFAGCNDDNSTQPNPDTSKIQVFINDIPIPTEVNLRIPYTLKLWEYEKAGMKLVSIQVLDDITKSEILKLDGEDIPHIYKNPLPATHLIDQDVINAYYVSIQLPIPLNAAKPSRISHKLTLQDTVNNKTVYEEGGVFTPRLSETPMVISSPVKGENWLFINQSTNAYHFYVNFFTEGKVYNAERFAFDNIKLNESKTDIFDGDPEVNESYPNYGDTLYAVADGKILTVVDGRPENKGNKQDVTFNSLDEYAGNYIVLELSNGKKAFYAHCQPNKFLVSQGASVKEGDPLALLGNSGNSTGPHLHFHIFEGSHILLSYGVPFVLKEYIKMGEWGDNGANLTPKQTFYNAMMEQFTILSFE